jgi:DNA primase
MDQHAALRSLPLSRVISWLGIPGPWKERKGGTEWSGKCPLHKAAKNNTSFSFGADGKFHCFSCGSKGRGAYRLTMAYRKVGFQDAVDELRRFNGAQVLTGEAVVKMTLQL